MSEVGVTCIGARVPENKGFSFRDGLFSSAVTKSGSQKPIRIKCQAVHQRRPSTYSSQISTDIPFYEAPGASFDRYLDDKSRVFGAIFPDKRRTKQLNEEEWRVHLLPIEFLYLTASPIVDMSLRCKTDSDDYPSGISPAITKVLLLETVRWELQGLDNPSHFKLGVSGTLYSDRQGVRSRLKGQLEMKLSVILPPFIPLIPEDLHKSVAEPVLKTLLENMKDNVNSNLLADYGKFRREQLINPV